MVCLQRRRVSLTPEQASEFYAEHFGKPFFPSLVAYMSSGPILALALAREKAVTCWRELIGPTSAIKARTTHPDRQAFEHSMHAFYVVAQKRCTLLLSCMLLLLNLFHVLIKMYTIGYTLVLECL